MNIQILHRIILLYAIIVMLLVIFNKKNYIICPMILYAIALPIYSYLTVPIYIICRYSPSCSFEPNREYSELEKTTKTTRYSTAI